MTPDEISKAISAFVPWVNDSASALVVLMVAGRAIKSLREGHGIVGWCKSLLYGSSYLPGNKPANTTPATKQQE